MTIKVIVMWSLIRIRVNYFIIRSLIGTRLYIIRSFEDEHVVIFRVLLYIYIYKASYVH